MSTRISDFVSNFLHQTQGYSEDITVEYIVHTARQSKNVQDIENALECGDAQQKRAFASKLFGMVPKKHEQEKKRKLEKEMQYQRKVALANQKYKLIQLNEDEDVSKSSTKKKKKKEKDKNKKKSKKKSKNKNNNIDKSKVKDKKRKRDEKQNDKNDRNEPKIKFQPSSQRIDKKKHKDKDRNKKKSKHKSKSYESSDDGTSSNEYDSYDSGSDESPPKKKRRLLSLVSFCSSTIVNNNVNILAQTDQPRQTSHPLTSDNILAQTVGKEEEMERDQQEKRLFEARLRKKDLERQKLAKLTQAEKEALEEDRRRQAITNRKEMAYARKQSSRHYKAIRAPQQAILYKQSIEDELRMFDDEDLTKQERKERKLKMRAKELVDDAHKLRSKDSRNVYRIPDEYGITEDGKIDKKARNKVLQARYDDGETIENFRDYTKRGDNNNGNSNDNDPNFTNYSFRDQQAWESNKMATAYTNKGNKTEDEIWFEKSKKENYSLIMDDQIEFITEELLQGHDLEKELKTEIEKQEKLERGKTKKEKFEELSIFRTTLPIYKYKDEFLSALSKYQILIVVAETGSGKTTQIPQYIYENRDKYLGTDGKMAITQPRRVAAMSVAARVSEEVGCRLGTTVGYSVRFEDKTNESTVLQYMTDGRLLREFLDLTNFSKYKVIMIDEAHERTLHTDILFGLVKDACRWKSNENLKLIISSATLQADKFCNFFDNAPKFIIPGRPYPVTSHYLTNPESDYLEACVITILQIHTRYDINSGDILVFLTGQEEIDIVKESLQQKMQGLSGSQMKELKILPIYANLPSDQQILVFEPAPKDTRKCILATNIAETSLTIDGIAYVIDPGFSKQNYYDPRSGMDSLIVTPISQASAEQRKGRAGRTGAGNCYRLYTKYSYNNEMLAMTIPEIQRTNLGNVVLTLKSIGINNIIEFDYMDAPPAESLKQALECLYAMGAFNIKGELTKLGRKMAEFPINPEFSKILCHAETYHCVSEILTIISMLSSNHIVWYRPSGHRTDGNSNNNSNSNEEPLSVTADTMHRNFWKINGDMYTLENVYSQWVETNYSKEWTRNNFLQWRALNRARDIREQLENLLERVEIEVISVREYIKENNLINYENMDKGLLDENDPNAVVAGITKEVEFIGKALCSGLFMRVAKFDASKGKYKCIKSKSSVMIHPSSSLAHTMNSLKGNTGNNSNSNNNPHRMGGRNKGKNDNNKLNPPKWVLFSELVLTTQEYMRNVIEIEPTWLYEVAPHYWRQSDAESQKNDKRRKGQPKIKQQNVKRGTKAPVV